MTKNATILVGALLLFDSTVSAEKAPWVGQTLSDVPCTGKFQGYGPFDYADPNDYRTKLGVVEQRHFTPQISQLSSDLTAAVLAKNVDYTLRAFPNHHRALQTMARFQLRMVRPRNAGYSAIECYFERAINFRPNDSKSHQLYGIYLHKVDRHALALEHYQAAEKLEPNNVELHYNMGLLYIDLKRFKEANEHAVNAYQGGYPLAGLKNKLKRLGYWKKPDD